MSTLRLHRRVLGRFFALFVVLLCREKVAWPTILAVFGARRDRAFEFERHPRCVGKRVSNFGVFGCFRVARAVSAAWNFSCQPPPAEKRVFLPPDFGHFCSSPVRGGENVGEEMPPIDARGLDRSERSHPSQCTSQSRTEPSTPVRPPDIPSPTPFRSPT